MIKDSFSELPISRQRKYQMRKRASGMCVTCGQPAVTKNFCLDHSIAHRERHRLYTGATKRYRSLTYELSE